MIKKGCEMTGHTQQKIDGQSFLANWNRRFAQMSAEERVQAALENFCGAHVLTSSFGAQAAVSLHMVASAQPGVPVVLLDTGYLFPETYEFVDTLTQQLDLNLQVYRAKTSPAWQEARYGQRWLQGVEGIEAYNYDNKVEPLQRALKDLHVGTWFTGIRRNQADSRAETPFVQQVDGRFKVAPIADWTDRDVHQYLTQHGLPYHPLWNEGYISIGDTHTTRSVHEVDDESQTRFFGLKRECGIHEMA